MKSNMRSVILGFLAAGLLIIGWLHSYEHHQPASSLIEISIPSPVLKTPAVENNPEQNSASAPVPPPIVLHGTYINGQATAALISLNNEEQRWRFPRDYLNPDFYLGEIYKNYIVIRDKKNTVSLEIHIAEGGASEELPEVIPAVPAHAWVESLPPVPGIERMAPNRYRIKREMVIKELQSGEIFKQVRIMPEESGGFSIDRIRRGSMAEVIGLHVGDTIHKINDKPLTNITDVLDLYKNLDSMEKVDVEISRSNEVQQLHYELN